jgi:hypothetical protein
MIEIEEEMSRVRQAPAGGFASGSEAAGQIEAGFEAQLCASPTHHGRWDRRGKQTELNVQAVLRTGARKELRVSADRPPLDS